MRKYPRRKDHYISIYEEVVYEIFYKREWLLKRCFRLWKKADETGFIS